MDVTIHHVSRFVSFQHVNFSFVFLFPSLRSCIISFFGRLRSQESSFLCIIPWDTPVMKGGINALEPTWGEPASPAELIPEWSLRVLPGVTRCSLKTCSIYYYKADRPGETGDCADWSYCHHACRMFHVQSDNSSVILHKGIKAIRTNDVYVPACWRRCPVGFLRLNEAKGNHFVSSWNMGRECRRLDTITEISMTISLWPKSQNKLSFLITAILTTHKKQNTKIYRQLKVELQTLKI